MSLPSQEVIDKLYTKYGILDKEGYLVDVKDAKFQYVVNRIEKLANKSKLTSKEEREGAELIIIQKAYMKELQNAILYGTCNLDLDDEDSNESSFIIDDDEDYDDEEDESAE